MPKQNNTLSILTHILGFFTNFLGPLIILLTSKDNQTKKHAKTVLNWQLSFLIYSIISYFLIIVLIGLLLLPVLGLLNLIFSIIGAVRASEGEIWKYPLSIRFFKIK